MSSVLDKSRQVLDTCARTEAIVSYNELNQLAVGQYRRGEKEVRKIVENFLELGYVTSPPDTPRCDTSRAEHQLMQINAWSMCMKPIL